MRLASTPSSLPPLSSSRSGSSRARLLMRLRSPSPSSPSPDRAFYPSIHTIQTNALRCGRFVAFLVKNSQDAKTTPYSYTPVVLPFSSPSSSPFFRSRLPQYQSSAASHHIQPADRFVHTPKTQDDEDRKVSRSSSQVRLASFKLSTSLRSLWRKLVGRPSCANDQAEQTRSANGRGAARNLLQAPNLKNCTTTAARIDTTRSVCFACVCAILCVGG